MTDQTPPPEPPPDLSPGLSPDDTGPAEAALLAALRRALGPDPLPDGLLARAEALLAFADVDRELAELLGDAAPELAGTRGDASTAEVVLTFELADGSVTIELTLGRSDAAGQLLGDPAAALTLEGRDGAATPVAVDSLGHFALPYGTHGPVRLVLTTADGRAVGTDWFLL